MRRDRINVEEGMDFNPNSKKPHALQGILKKWIKCNVRLAEAWKKPTNEKSDVPWWYGERALLSVFAGAVWTAGGLVFEEYIVNKKNKKKGGRPRNKYRDREDIYFKIGEHNFVGEAKTLIHELQDMNKLEDINSQINKAESDVKKTRSVDLKGKRLAFVIPCLKIKSADFKESRVTVNEYLEAWLKRVKSDVDYSCCAWVFPKKFRNFRSTKYKGIFPGAIIFIKEVDRL